MSVPIEETDPGAECQMNELWQAEIANISLNAYVAVRRPIDASYLISNAENQRLMHRSKCLP